MRNVSVEVTDEIKANILCSKIYFLRNCAVRDVRKHGTARQATDDNKILQRKGEIGMPDTEEKHR
jgi:hypothetical protein